ncbi:MAG TPA: hypothetical protein P5119_00220 [Candidatus Aminicenantes bacterium]|nr:hypothetical protein [Candidatus Aminicenantes bacterium]HRY63749.1 hypothetical protein [Candidatus Aminicenantes bacterium]HRZ70662.1 hypothetical protein [Candidatus Aminicenantes bacterium]
MDDWFASEDFARAPLARVLAEIWRQGLSGSLYARSGGVPKCLSFERGFLTLDSVSFEEKDFLRFLLTTGGADLIALTRVEEHAQKTGVSSLRALAEIPLFTPERLWQLLEGYAREEALALAADASAEREFHTRSGPPARVYVEAIDVPSLLLEAVRRIEDPAALARLLPAGDETIRRLPAFSPDAFGLSLVERYVLGLLDPPKTVAEACAESDAGGAATRRALGALLLVGLAGTAAPRPKTARLPGDLSLASMDRILGLFNAKCAFVFKYVSKEIGPVAFNLIGKAVDEVRGRLDPALQGAELQPDGRLELKSPLRLNANIAGDDCRVSMLRSMDEVLTAEVLVVKRTLGPEHESALVRSLERLGEVS